MVCHIIIGQSHLLIGAIRRYRPSLLDREVGVRIARTWQHPHPSQYQRCRHTGSLGKCLGSSDCWWRQFIAISKDGIHFLRNNAILFGATCKPARYPELFQRLVDPLSPVIIQMTIGNKSQVTIFTRCIAVNGTWGMGQAIRGRRYVKPFRKFWVDFKILF